MGDKWNLGLTGFNDTTGGACWLCYSHSSYYAEVPDPKSQREEYEIFIKIWGEPSKYGNPSLPKLVKPINSEKGDNFNENVF